MVTYREIKHVIVIHLVHGNFGGLGGNCGHNVQTFSIGIGVLGVICRPLKGATPESASLDFKTPRILVDILEVVFQDQAILQRSTISNEK